MGRCPVLIAISDGIGRRCNQKMKPMQWKTPRGRISWLELDNQIRWTWATESRWNIPWGRWRAIGASKSLHSFSFSWALMTGSSPDADRGWATSLINVTFPMFIIDNGGRGRDGRHSFLSLPILFLFQIRLESHAFQSQMRFVRNRYIIVRLSQLLGHETWMAGECGCAFDPS